MATEARQGERAEAAWRDASPLARVDGPVPLTAAEAILKGVLESELPFHRLIGPARPPFLPIFRRAAEESAALLLQRHACEVIAVGDAARSVSLGARAAMAGRASLLLLGNDQLYYAMPALQALPARMSGGLVLMLEDHAAVAPAAPPRPLMAELGIACLEPHDLERLRDSLETALRISRGDGRPAAILADVGLLRSLDTIEAKPNRIVDRIDLAAAERRRRRVPRMPEGGGPLRLARRLELNTVRAMPSPGEREPLGLIVAGAALQPTQHLLAEVGLAGRVPLVALGLVSPIDDALVSRLLQRCEQVVVLEARPGGLAAPLAEVIEQARRRGEEPAVVWWRSLPPSEPGEAPLVLESGDALRPSRLARKLLHLLHPVRPMLQVGSRLVAIEAGLAEVPVPERGAGLGAAGAAALVREVLDEVDRRIRRGGEGGEPGVALAIDGVDPPAAAGRTIPAEIWDRKRFSFEGPAAVRQAIRARGTRLMVVCDVGGEDEVDVQRLAEAALPADPGELVSVRTVDLNDRERLRSELIDAAGEDRLAVIVARDGPPPRFDPIAAERLLAEVDRLGYASRQRLVQLAEAACVVAAGEDEQRSLRPLEPPPPLATRGWIRRLATPAGGAFRVRLRPFLEQIDVIRTRPPTSGEDGPPSPAPKPRHAAAARWRAHLAGYRGDSPGVLAGVLCEAGAIMGYRVRATWEPTPIGAGRRAWAQVLFTRDGAVETAPLVAGIPYGEADLLLGIDPEETLRALGPDPNLRVAAPGRTHAVVNLAAAPDRPVAEWIPERLADAVGRSCAAGAMVGDHLDRCRRSFLTDRLLDLVLLGMAFERGLVPVTLEAMRQALLRVESRGFGRLAEAFAQGRRLAAAKATPAAAAAFGEEPIERAITRAVRELVVGGARRRERIGTLARDSLALMPGLLESRAGRRSAGEFVRLLAAASVWGGREHAIRYAERIRRLYAVDRGDTARELTRLAIRPVAEALLVRDLFQVSAMSMTPWHVARLRRALRVRPARGDRVERRFLLRLDAILLGRRIRWDLRTSDWLPIALARLRGLVPWRWRGTPGERRLREQVLASVERAVVELGTSGDEVAYRRWCDAFRGMAMRRRLRGPAVTPAPPREG